MIYDKYIQRNPEIDSNWLISIKNCNPEITILYSFDGMLCYVTQSFFPLQIGRKLTKKHSDGKCRWSCIHV